jgi:transposase
MYKTSTEPSLVRLRSAGWGRRTRLEEAVDYSPNLNPIERLWAILKRTFYQQFPAIERLRRPKDYVERELGRALQLAWESIPEDVLERLGKSMRRRVRAVKGWHTKY